MARADEGRKAVHVKDEVHYRLKLWAAVRRISMGQAVAELLNRAEKHEQEARDDSGL
jgi:predicted HicB family RNase H-like nuclease